MNTPFSQTFSTGGQPQRRVLKSRVRTDAQGNMVPQPCEGEAHVISDEGSLDTFLPDFDAFLDCGCSVRLNEQRYQCFDCSAVVCGDHIKYCGTCSKPICTACAFSFETTPGQQIYLCETHYREARRRRNWSRIAKVALSPFVTFDNRNSPK